MLTGFSEEKKRKQSPRWSTEGRGRVAAVLVKRKRGKSHGLAQWRRLCPATEEGGDEPRLLREKDTGPLISVGKKGG